jgi:hypothetical protein
VHWNLCWPALNQRSAGQQNSTPQHAEVYCCASVCCRVGKMRNCSAFLAVLLLGACVAAFAEAEKPVQATLQSSMGTQTSTSSKHTPLTFVLLCLCLPLSNIQLPSSSCMCSFCSAASPDNLWEWMLAGRGPAQQSSMSRAEQQEALYPYIG